MKLPITDEFLFQAFRLTQKVGDVHNLLALRTMREAVYPELRRVRRTIQKKRNWKNFSQLVYYLKRKGYIQIKSLETRDAVVLTPKGVARVLRVQNKTASKKKRKDGRWQMIIFDVPEERKRFREILRAKLQELYYQRLQDSVWVCPYDVFKETERFIREYDLDDCVRLFLIKEIDV